jgi:hypothetical protein
MVFDSRAHPVTVYPSNLCHTGGVSYEQSGSPLPIYLPNIKGAWLTGSLGLGPPCLSLGEWTSSHLDYEHALLDGLFWLLTTYASALGLIFLLRLLRTLVEHMKQLGT